ncbi:hypothetical protein [Caballeronia humi]|uniref:Uncharacterized protein n=1 Tax=Caballeronia humi TaxID=326474 RepID=A0A158HHC8_9BURK|nr:hypothetical protein [Caballeronia humi]SAL43736.1 hypothetical protein AWB65_03361 [Caballeronia humi]
MKIDHRELLVFVAIVSSAIVMQIRQHALDTQEEAPEVRVEQMCEPPDTARTLQVVPATCERPIDRRSAVPRAGCTRVWV